MGGGYCTEVVARAVEGRKVGKELGVGAMQEDNQRVGFIMGRRAGESGLPHERTHLRRMGRIEGTDGDPGDADEGRDEVCAPCGEGAILNAAQRAHRLGCPGCGDRGVQEACEGCGGWLGRPMGSMPKCTRQTCPGAADAGGWVLVGPWKRRDREARRDDRAPYDVHIRPARVVVGLAVASDPPV